MKSVRFMAALLITDLRRDPATNEGPSLESRFKRTRRAGTDPGVSTATSGIERCEMEERGRSGEREDRSRIQSGQGNFEWLPEHAAQPNLDLASCEGGKTAGASSTEPCSRITPVRVRSCTPLIRVSRLLNPKFARLTSPAVVSQMEAEFK